MFTTFISKFLAIKLTFFEVRTKRIKFYVSIKQHNFFTDFQTNFLCKNFFTLLCKHLNFYNMHYGYQTKFHRNEILISNTVTVSW